MVARDQPVPLAARARWNLDLKFAGALVPATSLVILLGVVGYVVATNGHALLRSWFLYPDEWVYAFEVVRFSTGDFHQQFYDNPGTPLMLLSTAALWVVYLPSCVAAGSAPQCANFGSFGYANVPMVIGILRLFTFGCYVFSVVLLFACARKMFDSVSALVASLLLAFSWVYVLMSDSVRSEPLGNVFVLTGLLIFLYQDSLGFDRVRTLVPVGVLAGLGAAARYTSLGASAPFVLLLIVSSSDPGVRLTYSRSEAVVARSFSVVVVAASLCVLGGLTAGASLDMIRQFEQTWPFTTGFFIKIAAGVVTTAVLLAGLYVWPRTRPLAERVVQPRSFYFCIGTFAGFLIGTPTLLWEYERFFTSINFYLGSYIDVLRMDTPFPEKLTDYLTGYLNVIAPDNEQRVLLGLGAVLAIALRNRYAVAAAIVCALFFVSKPLDLIAAPHHVIPWLPLYAVVMAFPVFVASGLLKRFLDRMSGSSGPLIPAAATACASVVIVTAVVSTINNGPSTEGAFTASEQDRLDNVQQASDWIRAVTPPGSETYSAYYCFNDGVFYTWMATTGLSSPNYVEGEHKFTMWWGQRSILQGKAGYACATRADVVNIHDAMLKQYNDGTDPYTDPAFHLLESFGAGRTEVDVFSFDLR